MLVLLLTLTLSAPSVPSHAEKSFLSWMRSTHNFYTGSEYHLRFGIFLANSRFVQSHNSQSRFRVSLNHLATLTPAEYRSLLGTLPPATFPKSTKSSVIRDFPSYDWREFGVVTGVKDQGTCGSCWAFAAISSAESSFKIITGTLYDLSEQNLVDCVTTCYGCNGGLATLAYDYVLQYQHGQFQLTDDYPYTGSTGISCKFDSTKAVAQIYGYLAVVSENEADLASKLVGYGPATGAVDASTGTFQLYSGGIFDDSHCSSLDLNHGVGIVGFGVEDDVGYWIVKNSWGEGWGEDGYIRLIRGKNECGVASYAQIASSTQ
jgi:cathepsin L